jgi:hypothetical protein
MVLTKRSLDAADIALLRFPEPGPVSYRTIRVRLVYSQRSGNPEEFLPCP